MMNFDDHKPGDVIRDSDGTLFILDRTGTRLSWLCHVDGTAVLPCTHTPDSNLEYKTIFNMKDITDMLGEDK